MQIRTRVFSANHWNIYWKNHRKNYAGNLICFSYNQLEHKQLQIK